MLNFQSLPKNYVIDEVPIYTGAMSAFPYSESYAARYKFKTTYGDDVNMAIRDGNTLLVPRETAPISGHDFRERYDPPLFAINCNFTPRDEEQATLPYKSIELLKHGRNHVFEAPTGWGKTIAGGVVGCALGQPTLIVVTKQDLVDQWQESLIDILGVPANLIGHVQQDVCDWQGKHFVIGMVQSLIIPERYPKEMYNYFGLAIYDEVDMMAADCFVRSCQMYPAYYRFGLSATPKRPDGKHRVIDGHIGPIMVRGTIVPMKPKILVRKTGWSIPTHKRLVGNEYVLEKIPYAPNRMMIVMKAMAGNTARNMEIVNFAVQAYKADRNVLILADMLVHLERLFHLITQEGVPGNEIGYYVGGMSKIELTANKVRRVILGTYKMVSKGTNVPQWDSLVLATPKANVKQPMGRVLRSMLGKKQPVILDLVDWDSIFHNFHLSRCKSYYQVGATILQMG